MLESIALWWIKFVNSPFSGFLGDVNRVSMVLGLLVILVALLATMEQEPQRLNPNTLDGMYWRRRRNDEYMVLSFGIGLAVLGIVWLLPILILASLVYLRKRKRA